MVGMGCGPTPGSSDESSTSTEAPVDPGSSTQSIDPTMHGSSSGPKLDVAHRDDDAFPFPPTECDEDWGDCMEPHLENGLLAQTPVGEFELPVAMFGSSFSCLSCPVWPVASLHMPTDPTTWDQNALDFLHVELNETPEAGVPSAARLLARRGTDFASTDATVTFDALPTFDQILTPEDPQVPASVTGTVHVEASGWSVSGTFTATYCALQSSINKTCE
jgi:hypothetical protein